MRRTLTLLCTATATATAIMIATALPASAAHEDLDVTGLTQNGRLVTFPASDPGDVSNPVKVAGIADGYELAAIDYRPSTDALYGVAGNGTSAQLYRIGDGGAATPVGVPFPLAGDVSIDFNPTVDRLRVVSNDGTNLRLNPDTGGVTVDSRLAYVDANAGNAPSVVAIAYTNNDCQGTVTAPCTVPGTAIPNTMLFDLDRALGALSQQTNPNLGQLTERFDIAPRFASKTGYDIYNEGSTNVGIVSIFSRGRTTLYTLNASTGVLTLAGTSTNNSSTVGSTPAVIDVAVPTAQ